MIKFLNYIFIDVNLELSLKEFYTIEMNTGLS